MDNQALNRAIAERVMGFTVAEKFCASDPDCGEWEHVFWIDDQSAYADNPRYQMRHCFYVIEIGEWIPLPDYANDIKAAFAVVEQMRALDWAFTLNTTSSVLGTEYLSWFTRLIKPSATGFAKESVPALSICLAALDGISSINNSVLQSNSQNTRSGQ